jgi:hypothetical protein
MLHVDQSEIGAAVTVDVFDRDRPEYLLAVSLAADSLRASCPRFI